MGIDFTPGPTVHVCVMVAMENARVYLLDERFIVPEAPPRVLEARQDVPELVELERPVAPVGTTKRTPMSRFAPIALLLALLLASMFGLNAQAAQDIEHQVSTSQMA